ncbi:Flp pilus assembly protein TadB [Bartonella fuyuanensis]|uniref:Flp pilus assembly protein TadB n=1 Tax=Bartonella fuyuanensis TaxID=1460968 RepID=A0A840DU20_9HYPH|nr:hypothetical protein [Bartonella fuyuanensis]MBB4076551.1 Flp pilus assembly protein TadB [Bartonella fuyuanensis]
MILWIKKYLTMTMAIIAAFLIALMKAFFLGKRNEKQKQTNEAFKIAATRLEVENEINKKSDADVRTKLSSWLRDE